MIKIIKIFLIFCSFSCFGAERIHYFATLISQSCPYLKSNTNCRKEILIPQNLEKMELQCIDGGCFGQHTYNFEEQDDIYRAIVFIYRDTSSQNKNYFFATHLYSLDGESFFQQILEFDSFVNLPSYAFTGPWSYQEKFRKRTILKISRRVLE